MNYIIGQRWISHTEPQLGLGIVAERSGRRVTISFPAVAEQRIYAGDNAPLSRVIYKVGDRVSTLDEIELTITAAQELRGILIYTGIDSSDSEHTLAELDLNCFVQFTTPRQRLFSGQFDKDPAFQLRMATLFRLDEVQGSRVRGLLGARTSLLPHQIYIASEVANRYAPRVLLADEVGLGKTIEAGMILHQQLLTGRANRVLIVVPPTLLHQWLVEMLRRFNLRFALFDRERYDALAEEHELNPFHSEQLVLCSLDFLCSSEEIQLQATAAGWDLLVVDEAHHLHWSEQGASPEYRCIEQISGNSKGLLLLTATPEQAGIASHFARLRLLDPSRFHSLAAFEQEEAGYRQLNQLVQQLQGAAPDFSTELIEQLRRYLGDSADELARGRLELDTVLRRLLDRHGTGRVLFRNTRSAIPRFPERHLSPTALPCPTIYQQEGRHYGPDGLYPEQAAERDQWLADDPRVSWLQDLLRRVRPDKVLIICAHSSTAVALEYQLHMRAGLRTTAFHEGLSLVERDRAAAWFAEHDNGAQALVCSEIGSEGRNFQFAHHLVLFDLPLNPDLLEQRIGRLDRIGQRHRIEIHAPYLQDSAQEILYHWYREGMDLFEHSCAAAYSIYEKFEPRLLRQLSEPDDDLSTLISDTADFTRATQLSLQQGRDPLLELNSCNPQRARQLIEAIEATENGPVLQQYMERLFDQFGVDHEFHSEHALVLRPGEQMLGDHFPGLPDAGTTVTFDRQLALVREDMEFLSWEHPMVVDAMDMVLCGQLGNAALSSIEVRGLPAGTLLLETCFTISCPAPARLQLPRYLPLSPIRLLVDSAGKNLSEVISHSQLNPLCSKVKRATALAIINRVRDEIDRMLEVCEQIANAQLEDILAAAGETMATELSAEADRLSELQKHNPSVRNEEISYYRQQIVEGQRHIQRAGFELAALRVIVTT